MPVAICQRRIVYKGPVEPAWRIGDTAAAARTRRAGREHVNGPGQRQPATRQARILPAAFRHRLTGPQGRRKEVIAYDAPTTLVKHLYGVTHDDGLATVRL